MESSKYYKKQKREYNRKWREEERESQKEREETYWELRKENWGHHFNQIMIIANQSGDTIDRLIKNGMQNNLKEACYLLGWKVWLQWECILMTG